MNARTGPFKFISPRVQSHTKPLMERMLKRERESNGASIFTEETSKNDPISKRRTIRSHYRDIENRINEGKDDLANADSDKFMAIMNEVENIHQHENIRMPFCLFDSERVYDDATVFCIENVEDTTVMFEFIIPVNKPREQVADAETLLGLTRTLAASVKTHTSGGVTPAEFVSCLIREFGKEDSMKQRWKNSQLVSWQHIGVVVSPIFMTGPGFMTMIGPLENALKQRRMVFHSKRTRSMVKARPEELGKAAEVLTDTDKTVQVMFGILKKEKRVKVETLILNRFSFAQTVENLFALSFLVKDGRVRMDVDESGSEVVVPTNGPSAEDIKSRAVKNHEFIFRFDFNDRKLLKTVVREEEELMPQRETFANEAKGELCDQDISPAYASQVVHTSQVKKFSKNRTTCVPC